VDRTNGTEPYHPASTAWRRVFRSRAHFALADVLARRAAAIGAELTAMNQYDVVVSSGPPHTAHEAAKTIAARAVLPLVLDMRDPWSDESAMPDELRGAVWRRETRARERACVSAANLVVVTSQAHEELQIAKYPDVRGRIVTVMNGADSDPLPTGSPGNRFVIAFTGLIYLGRNPRPLFRAAARVALATGASPNEFAVEFMGGDACDGVPLTTIAREEGLGAHFRSHGFRPRREALELLSNATLLVSLPLRTEMTLPAKLFEYTRFDAWLLALADSDSATARLLADTAADVVPPDDVDAIERAITNRFAQFRAGARPVALNRDGRFDRATQSARLFDALEELSATSRQR
jgi:glycosyltransferase involved in cell wall biosynthesis